MDQDGLLSIAVPGRSEMLANGPLAGGFPEDPTAGLAAGQSFGPLTVKEYPNSTPFDGMLHRLRLTLLPVQSQNPALEIEVKKPVRAVPVEE
jgi:hypothetical protein